MKEAYSLAQRSAVSGAAKGKRSYDTQVRSSILQPDDRVLVRNMRPRGGPGKLRPYWEEKIYKVIRRKGPDSPVYEVKPEFGTGHSRVLHRNLLMSCGSLPVYSHGERVNPPAGDPNKRARTRPCREPTTPRPAQTSDEDESETEYIVDGLLVSQGDSCPVSDQSDDERGDQPGGTREVQEPCPERIRYPPIHLAYGAPGQQHDVIYASDIQQGPTVNTTCYPIGYTAYPQANANCYSAGYAVYPPINPFYYPTGYASHPAYATKSKVSDFENELTKPKEKELDLKRKRKPSKTILESTENVMPVDDLDDSKEPGEEIELGDFNPISKDEDGIKIT
ncbi:hypothetical protein QZH41_002536 [Actinostola sp. cb2023]|nr:hypothetical protein QZH41_002536 [Actinostola sp. cb2023]